MSSIEYDQEKAFNEELAKITDENIKTKLLQIKGLVVKRINLEKDFRVEQAKLEAKYEKEYAPLYKERADIVSGVLKVKASDVENAIKNVTVTETEEKEQGVPDYWLTCLKNTSHFTEMINKKDEAVLKNLKNISLEYKENGDFSIFFHFNPNSYFKHTTYILHRHFILDDKQNIKKIESSKIEWENEDVNPTVERKKKKLKNKSKPNEVKTIVKLEEVPSFFNFFKDYTAPENPNSHSHAHHKKSEDDEEEVDENEFIEDEYEIGVFIKDELIPYSLEYYLDLVDEEDDDLDEEDEDYEDDEEEKKPKKKLF